MIKYVSTTISNQSLNARHFAAMSEADAVKAIIADGFTDKEAWAKKAYNACVADVKKADEKPAEKPADDKSGK